MDNVIDSVGHDMISDIKSLIIEFVDPASGKYPV
jgi:hypothetical protein